MEDVILGGGHWTCDKCGKDIKGSSIVHFCNEIKENLIIENNKKIAQFLGYTYYAHNDPRLEYIDSNGNMRRFEPGWKTTPDTNSSEKYNYLHNIIGRKNNSPIKHYLGRHHTSLQFNCDLDRFFMAFNKCIKYIEENKINTQESLKLVEMKMSTDLDLAYSNLVKFIETLK